MSLIPMGKLVLMGMALNGRSPSLLDFGIPDPNSMLLMLWWFVACRLHALQHWLV